MAERLSELLRQKVAGIWEAQHQHPFVRGIGDGTLGLERFEFWLRQDYVFLISYAVFCLKKKKKIDNKRVYRDQYRAVAVLVCESVIYVVKRFIERCVCWLV